MTYRQKWLWKVESLVFEPKKHNDFSPGSNGVMLMLQQLMADAKAMETEATAAEAESQQDYEVQRSFWHCLIQFHWKMGK